jgi:glycosyltransferase involved in cell wall biosynthesis
LASGDGGKVRAKLGLAAETPIVMYTGALESFQRVDYLLQAMALVAKQVPEAMLVIVGNIKNQKAQEALLAMAEQLGIAKRLLFVESAPIEELPDYLAAADVTVVPRPSCPGYPIKLLNYMAAGKPVVSFAGSAKSLCHEYSGYIAANDDVEDLANGIQMLLQHPDVAKIMGQRARESLEGVFDWPTLAAGVAETYRQLMKDRKRFARTPLAKYFKQSYTPVLENPRQISPFLKDGELTYPSLLQDHP